MKEITIQRITDELHKAYDLLNERFFNGELPTIALTIQSSGKRTTAMGWCTQKPAWHSSDGTIQLYEINISAEFLRIAFLETMDTLMHEMVHLDNSIKGIKDTSRGGTYHNKTFRDTAIAHGFEHKNDKPDKKYGYSFVSLTEETKNIINTMPIDQELFKIARLQAQAESEEGESEEGEKSPQERKKSYRWVCPECDQIIRSSKPDIKVICGRCRCDFECTDV